LHDALHAQVDHLNSSNGNGSKTHRDNFQQPEELWRQVMHLERICLNPKPTMFSQSATKLVQLPAQSYATSFDELLSVLAS